MKMTYYFTLTLICLFINSLAFSQTDRAEDAIKNAPYIFEGVVVGFKPIQDENNEYFISYKIEVKKKLKGDAFLIEKDTIELISVLPDGWHVINGGLGRSHIDHLPKSEQKGLGVDVKTHGVFFVKRNSENTTYFSPYSIKSDAYFDIVPTKKYNFQLNKTYMVTEVIGFSKTFISIDEFDIYLKSMKLSQLEMNEKAVKKKDAEFLEKSKFNKNQYSTD